MTAEHLDDLPDELAVSQWSCSECGAWFAVSGSAISMRTACCCGVTVEVLSPDTSTPTTGGAQP